MISGVKRRIATLFAVCCCCGLGGCASQSIYLDSVRPMQQNDSSRTSVTDVSSGVRGGVSLPHRDLIRVDFTAGTDLRDMVVLEGSILVVHSYFCDRGENVGALGGPGVYVDLKDAGKEKLVKRFLFFIDVARKPGPESIPPVPGFDLSVNPQDICFYVSAKSGATSYKSNVERIPKAAIEHVFIGWKLH
jgi:hypothetical protein